MTVTGLVKNDQRLLEHYLACGGPDAAPWNLSPESLTIEARMRSLLRAHVEVQPGMRVLNVGIGVGAWDDYLGYWLADRGQLTSLDVMPELCEVFAYRQQREGHPYAAEVVCADIRKPSELAPFDLVTMVGSTAREVGNHVRALDGCLALVKPGGQLFYMDFESGHVPGHFFEYARERDLSIQGHWLIELNAIPNGHVFLAETPSVG